MGQKAFELETGAASNESINRAVQLAVHGAVIELINDGVKKGHWAYAAADKITTTNPAEKTVETKAEKKTEVKAEDKK